MLDKISIGIVNELCHDGRYTNVELAKKLNISVVTAAKKVKALIDDGVISIKAMPNPNKLGYQTHAALLGLNVDLKNVVSVCNHLRKNPLVNMVTTSFGRFDILVIVFYRDLGQFQNFINLELYLIEGINNVETYLILQEEKRNTGIFSKNVVTSERLQIDELDYRLINELIKEGRPSYAILAKKIGVSKATISRRINYLLKNNIIQILAIPDSVKMGYSANAFILIKANIDEIPGICDQFSELSEVHLVMRVINGFSILVGVYSANPDTLCNFLLKDVANIHGILNIETLMQGNLYFFSAYGVLPPGMNESIPVHK